ncbi:MAG: YhjD/YihY/BrkB family envelope integrity protein [Microbacteriaceae bacterium]
MGALRRMIARLTAWRPVRAYRSYAARHGTILAGGLAYRALFSLFAAVWVLFSVAGLVLADDDALRASLVAGLAEAVPGLVSSGSSEGAIDPDALLATSTFSWTGAIALAAGLLTALGFLSASRDAIREMFGLPAAPGNGVLLRLRDLGFLVGLGALLLVSTALSVLGTAATDAALGLLGVAADSALGTLAARAVAQLAVVVIDTVAIGALLTLHAGVRMPPSRLWPGALLGGVAAAALTVLYQLGVIGGAGSNPLLASFVVILGLLVFLDLLCQVLLMVAALVATGLADASVAVAGRAPARLPRGSRARVSRPRIGRD